MSFEDRINEIYLKFLERNCKPQSENKVQPTLEDTVREITRSFIFNDDDSLPNSVISRRAFTRWIIKLKKCDKYHALTILSKMDSLGFEYCIVGSLSDSLDGTPIYDIVEFAELRGYVNDQEVKDLKKKTSKDPITGQRQAEGYTDDDGEWYKVQTVVSNSTI